MITQAPITDCMCLQLTGGNRYADIKWHFIGNVQTNKVKKLLGTLTTPTAV